MFVLTPENLDLIRTLGNETITLPNDMTPLLKLLKSQPDRQQVDLLVAIGSRVKKLDKFIEEMLLETNDRVAAAAGSAILRELHLLGSTQAVNTINDRLNPLRQKLLSKPPPDNAFGVDLTAAAFRARLFNIYGRCVRDDVRVISGDYEFSANRWKTEMNRVDQTGIFQELLRTSHGKRIFEDYLSGNLIHAGLTGRSTKAMTFKIVEPALRVGAELFPELTLRVASDLATGKLADVHSSAFPFFFLWASRMVFDKKPELLTKEYVERWFCSPNDNIQLDQPFELAPNNILSTYPGIISDAMLTHALSVAPQAAQQHDYLEDFRVRLVTGKACDFKWSAANIPVATLVQLVETSGFPFAINYNCVQWEIFSRQLDGLRRFMTASDADGLYRCEVVNRLKERLVSVGPQSTDPIFADITDPNVGRHISTFLGNLNVDLEPAANMKPADMHKGLRVGFKEYSDPKLAENHWIPFAGFFTALAEKNPKLIDELEESFLSCVGEPKLSHGFISKRTMQETLSTLGKSNAFCKPHRLFGCGEGGEDRLHAAILHPRWQQEIEVFLRSTDGRDDTGSCRAGYLQLLGLRIGRVAGNAWITDEQYAGGLMSSYVKPDDNTKRLIYENVRKMSDVVMKLSDKDKRRLEVMIAAAYSTTHQCGGLIKADKLVDARLIDSMPKQFDKEIFAFIHSKLQRALKGEELPLQKTEKAGPQTPKETVVDGRSIPGGMAGFLELV